MRNGFVGVIIEESLEKVKIIETRVEQVTEEHNTPWIKQWTLHTVEVAENQAERVAEEISTSLDSEHAWYADFKNDIFHYIIFRNKIFKVDRSRPGQYNEVTKFGLALGIPDYQLDFSPHMKEWKR